MTMKKKNVITVIICLVLVIAICGGVKMLNSSNNGSSYQDQNSSLKAENKQLEKQNVSVIGSYEDNDDGAAISLNQDHTGRYVYADPTDTDTDDTLTWKKVSGNTYIVKLDDSNVTSDLTVKVDNGTLTLTGDSNWNKERFTKSKKSLDLTKYLSEHDKKGGQVPQNNQGQANSNQGTGHPREKSLTEDGKTYTAHYDANGQVQSVSVTGSDGISRLGGDPSPYWQQKEKEIDEYGH